MLQYFIVVITHSGVCLVSRAIARREPLGGYGGMLPQPASKNFQIKRLGNAIFSAIQKPIVIYLYRVSRITSYTASENQCILQKVKHLQCQLQNKITTVSVS